MKPWVATCGETRARLSDYLDDELGARTRRRVTRHLARCKHCHALLESLNRTLEQLRSLGDVEQVPAQPATVGIVVEWIVREGRR